MVPTSTFLAVVGGMLGGIVVLMSVLGIVVWRGRKLWAHCELLHAYVDGLQRLLMQCDKELLDARGDRKINHEIRDFINEQTALLLIGKPPRV